MASRLQTLSSSFAASVRSAPRRFAASFEAPPARLLPPSEARHAAAGPPPEWDLPKAAAIAPTATAASFMARLDRTVALSVQPNDEPADLLDRHHEEGHRADSPADEAPSATVLDGVVLPPRSGGRQPEARASSLDEDAFERAFAALLSEAQQDTLPPQPAAAQQPAAAPQPALPDDDPHGIFNRMGRSMQYANTFNLGRIDIDRHFDALERSLALGPVPRGTPAVFALSDEELAEDITMTSSSEPPTPARDAFVQSPASGGPDSRSVAVAPAESVTVEAQPPLQSAPLQTEQLSAAAVRAPDPNQTHEMEPVAPV